MSKALENILCLIIRLMYKNVLITSFLIGFLFICGSVDCDVGVKRVRKLFCVDFLNSTT